MLENYGDILSVIDVSNILKINKKTTYQLLKSGKLSYRRVGRIYRITKNSLIEFLSK
ncbi:helix-turn-helix domain-containing protein [Kineothrix sp. MB12-C1]|uniref:helix-turn-helix domain-containing protein n=1 Tax=Kineothrix sp. MB12-C1 TaxID=3070215 RepID=UPI003FA6033B